MGPSGDGCSGRRADGHVLSSSRQPARRQRSIGSGPRDHPARTRARVRLRRHVGDLRRRVRRHLRRAGGSCGPVVRRGRGCASAVRPAPRRCAGLPGSGGWAANANRAREPRHAPRERDGRHRRTRARRWRSIDDSALAAKRSPTSRERHDTAVERPGAAPVAAGPASRRVSTRGCAHALDGELPGVAAIESHGLSARGAAAGASRRAGAHLGAAGIRRDSGAGRRRADSPHGRSADGRRLSKDRRGDRRGPADRRTARSG